MVTPPAPAAAPAAALPHRFIALDSWRGLAALSILFYHLGARGWIAGFPAFRFGWMLVDFFFVLSGFVIAWSYGARLAQGYPRMGFVLVRLGRLYPLHIATVAVWVVLEFLVFRPVLDEPHPLTELWRGVFLLDAFAMRPGNFYAPVSWAVGVEMVLYMLAAALFGRGKWAIGIAAALATASAWAMVSRYNVPFFGVLIQRGLLAFPIGIFACWLYRRMDRLQPGRGLMSALEIALVAALVWLLCLPQKTGAWLPGMDLFYMAMVLVFARDAGVVSRLLQMRLFVKLGQLSFAFFMVHLIVSRLANRFLPRLFEWAGHSDWVQHPGSKFGLQSIDPPPVISTGITLAIVAVALGAAWLAWRFIEEPARHWTRRFAP